MDDADPEQDVGAASADLASPSSYLLPPASLTNAVDRPFKPST